MMKKIFAAIIIVPVLIGCAGSGGSNKPGQGGGPDNGKTCAAQINTETLAKAAVSGFQASQQCSMTDLEFEQFVEKAIN